MVDRSLDCSPYLFDLTTGIYHLGEPGGFDEMRATCGQWFHEVSDDRAREMLAWAPVVASRCRCVEGMEHPPQLDYPCRLQ